MLKIVEPSGSLSYVGTMEFRMRNNLGHITRGDPVYRTRKMLEKEIAELEQTIKMYESMGEDSEIEELELERAKDMLDSLNSCFV